MEHRALEPHQRMIPFHLTQRYTGVSGLSSISHLINFFLLDMSILRGCLAYGGHSVSLTWVHSESELTQLQLLKHKEDIINLLSLLLNKTKSERGYSGTAAIVSRVMHTLSGVYPTDNRFVDGDLWAQSGRSD